MGSQRNDMPSQPSSKWAWRLVASYSQCHNAMSRVCLFRGCFPSWGGAGKVYRGSSIAAGSLWRDRREVRVKREDLEQETERPGLGGRWATGSKEARAQRAGES